MTLVEFLKARLAEDAWNNRIDPTEEWHVDHDGDEGGAFPPSRVVGRGHYLAYDAPESIASHMARHDPRRVAAEVEAKRRIVDHWPDPLGNWTAEQADAARAVKEQTLRQFAAVYADHPEYDEAWRV